MLNVNDKFVLYYCIILKLNNIALDDGLSLRVEKNVYMYLHSIFNTKNLEDTQITKNYKNSVNHSSCPSEFH